MHVTFITANYVARESNYALQPFNWGVADKATVDAFSGSTFSSKFDEMCRLIAAAGFKNIDIWVAHLNPTRVTDSQVNEAVAILKTHGLRVAAYTGGLGRPDMTRADGERVYKVAKAIGTPVIDVGLNPTNEKLAFELGKEYGIKYAIENHPEKTPRELIDRLNRMPSGYTDVIGVAQDTGFWGQFGYDAVKATRELKPFLYHMHLKQVKKHPDDAWHSCGYDEGVVDIQAVVKTLVEIGYTEAVSVEHEPQSEDPMPAVARSATLLRGWLGSAARS
ncbi:MAG: sugar phosphate isomerase/epimerase [Chloroflexota bacterium]|nr:MAG: sugar phosphate isomerase/epimerase [Chloroflexota bacterium]